MKNLLHPTAKFQITNNKWFDRLTTLSEVEGQITMTETQNHKLNDPRLEDEGFKGCRFEIDCRQLWARPLDPQCISGSFRR